MKSSFQPKSFNSRLILVEDCPTMKKLQKLQRSLSARIKMASANNSDVPRGHFVVYVGERYKRFVIPISYLNHPLFRDLLDCAEEEFGFNHPKGGLTIPCTEDYFINLTSSLGYS